MGISLNQAMVLLILPITIYPLCLWYRESRQFSPRRRRVIFLLRVMLLLCLLLALAGLEFRFLLGNQSVVFVFDASASCEKGRDKAEAFIREALTARNADDRAGVVAVGANARVEQPLSSNPVFSSLESIVDQHYSDLGAGLKLAEALIPQNSLKRVVLISDGQSNSGNLLEETAYLAGQGIRVDVVAMQMETEPEARVDSLTVPRKLYPGERFPLRVKINSNVSTSVLLRFYQDQNPIAEVNALVNRGENTFTSSAIIKDSGFHTFRVVAEFEYDSIAENNEANAFSVVHGTPRLLLVEGSSREGASIAAALSSLDIKTEVINPYQLPESINELNRYAAVILCNVPAEAVSFNSMAALNAAVKDMGMGLVMVGGDQSFGPGGYFETPVENALPVHMDLRGKKEIPSLGLMLLIDKSGSMSDNAGGYAKIDLAREAAIQSTEVLGPLDHIGVIVFDDTARWVVKMRKVDDLAAIQDDIATLRAGGGTSIYPALALAYDALKTADSKYKHIILLTDGQSASGGDYYFLARTMEKAGITMSTVAVGEGADTELLQMLAEWGRGRYYFTSASDTIPRIFTKETITALRSYLVEESFTPLRTASSEIMQGITAMPYLNGYVAASARDTAQVILSSPRGDPVLAGWQYGLGRSVAFTSDAGGRWAQPWISWKDYNRFWGNVISWVLPRKQDSSLSLEASIQEGRGFVRVDTDDFTVTSLLTEARIITPALESLKIELQAVAPGSYEGSFDAREPGVYLINVNQKKAGQIVASTSGGAALSYSPEYRTTGTDMALLRQVAETGKGSILENPREAFSDNLPPVRGGVTLWPWLLMMAACLLPLDIAARRLNIGITDFNRALNQVSARLGAGRSEVQPPGLSRLQERKQAVQTIRKNSYSQFEPDESTPRVVQTTPDNAKELVADEKVQPHTSRLLEAKKRARSKDSSQ